MTGTGLRFLFELPTELARLVQDFLFRPGDDADPRRIELPVPLGDGAGETRAVALERGLLGPPVGAVDAEACLYQIDWSSSVHRVAILPREILEALAWYLGLTAFGHRLRRIVLREDLRTLHANGLSADHLAFVYQLPGLEKSIEPDRVDEQDAASITPQRVLSEGWALVDEVARILPVPMASRLRLKLPPDSPASLERPSRLQPADPVFEWVRARVVNTWRPDFDTRLAALSVRASA